MNSQEFWEKDAVLKDLLFETNLSIAAIGEKLDLTRAQTVQRINQLGLDWVRRKNRKLSRGHAALTEMFQQLLPNETIVNEFHIGERLMLDIYCDSYKLAAEYHGIQHFFYSAMYHKDIEDLKAQQKRDERKVELCKELGIALVVFRYNDIMTNEIVYARILEAIKITPKIEIKKLSRFKGNHYYEASKQKQRDYRKQKYSEFKDRRKK